MLQSNSRPVRLRRRDQMGISFPKLQELLGTYSSCEKAIRNPPCLCQRSCPLLVLHMVSQPHPKPLPGASELQRLEYGIVGLGFCYKKD